MYYTIENIKDYKEELIKLIRSYWKESDERRLDYKVNIDWDTYMQLERIGVGTLVCASFKGELAGFLFCITTKCTHTGKTKNSVEIIMVHPGYRNQTVAAGLLSELESRAAEGSLLFFTLKTEFPHDDLAERLGYTHVENVYMKRCNNGSSDSDSSDNSSSNSSID